MPESGSTYCFSISAFLRIISQSMMTVSIVRMRLMRQRAATISSTRACSAGVAGWCMAANSSSIFWNSSPLSHSRRMVWREVKPWRRELREDFSFVSADLGPRDLAPLARAVSDLSCDGIVALLDLYYTFGIFGLSGLFGVSADHNVGIAVCVQAISLHYA